MQRKVFTIKAAEFTAAVDGLKAATIADTSAFVPAGQLLHRIQQGSNGLKRDILATTLRIVAGQPCSNVLPVLTELRQRMKDAKAAGDSSVGTVRAAVAALAARHGPDFLVPEWKNAAEARAAAKAAEAQGSDAPQDGAEDGAPQASAEEVAARQAAELEELRAIAAEAARLIGRGEQWAGGLIAAADLLAELRQCDAEEAAPAA